MFTLQIRKTVALAALTIGVFGLTGMQTVRAQPPTVVAVPAEENLITVQGMGEVQVAPDLARVNLGVVTQNADSVRAAQENATKTDALIKAIKAQGVADKDIQTVGYSVNPQYNYNQKPGENTPPQIVGYQVTNTVRVTVRKIADAGKVLDAGVKAGSNDAGSIAFDLSDSTRDKAQADVLRLAVESAKRKADVLAQAAGRILGSVFSISEGASEPVRPMYTMLKSARAADAAPITPVQAGELTISTTIVAKYRMR